MSRIRMSGQTAASVPTPPMGKATIFLDSVDGSFKAKFSDNSIVILSVTEEFIQDVVGNTFQSSNSVIFTYDDINNIAFLEVDESGLDAAQIPFTPYGDLLADNIEDAIKELEDEKQGLDEKSQPNGYASLGPDGKVPLAELPPINVVSSVFGRLGDVVAEPGDYTASQITNVPSGDILSTDVQGAIDELELEKQALDEKGQANGYASLGPDAKVPLAQLPDTVVGSVEYKGTWDADLNNPILVSGVGEKGDYYVVNVAGATNLDGVTDWKIGDWAIFNGIAWEKVDNTDAVTSVFGRIGTVVAQSGDYTASQITNVPSGDISSTNVQGAINELDNEKVPNTRQVIAGTGLNGGGNLSADRTFNITNTGVVAGSYGSASEVPTFTVNAQGQLTLAQNVPILIVQSQVTNLVTDLANKQPLDADLTALAALATTGIVTRTAANTYATRSIQGTAGNIDVVNGDGVSGNPVIDLPNVGTAGTFGAADRTLALTIDAKGRITNFGSTPINHNLLLNYVANQHVDHSAVNINSGYGLAGGGNITASRTLSVSLSSNEISNTTLFTTNSTTDVLITGLSSTPAAGTYLVLFSSDGQFADNNRISTVSIYVAGVRIDATQRSNNHFDQTRQRSLQTQSLVVLSGSQLLEARVRVSGGTISITNKSIILIRVA